MSPFDEIVPPGPVAVLWVAASTGWVVVAAALWRSMTGQVRSAAVLAHFLTLAAVMLRSLVLGHGLLETVLPATAGWWALMAVTGFRPARLIDPDGDALVLLAGWFAVALVVIVTGHHIVFSCC